MVHIQQKPNFNVHNPTGLQFLTKLRLGLSHLNSHRLDHNFSNCINPLGSCSLKVELLLQFFLCCHYFTNVYSTLLDETVKTDSNTLSFPRNEIVEVILYGNLKYDLNQNSDILNAAINFVFKSERFYGWLL